MRMFSTAQAEQSKAGQGDIVDELELQALEIQRAIDSAKKNIEENTREGLKISGSIAREVEEDKFIKQQRYDIFIAKMEQLITAEERWAKREENTVTQMQSSFVNSRKPLKNILYHYNKAAVRGFESSLVTKTLEQLNMTLKARGNNPRAYEDYTVREFDISWRMQMLSEHIKEALGDRMYFNHHFMGRTARQLGEIGYKDAELIQKYFDKLNKMIEQRANETNEVDKEPLTFQQAVYGTFSKFVPKHYVFDGFQSSQEFQKHLVTLLEWEVEKNNGLANMHVETSETIQDLEMSMGQLVEAANSLRSLQVDMQASIDSMRQQYFKIQEAADKHKFLEENKFVRLELLELQEKLVKAGYLEPEETQKISSSMPYDVRMERASRIFYEYVSDFAPELLSQQYEDFAKAAHDSVDARQAPKQMINLNELHDKISLASLSQALTGLGEQAMSYRREAHDQDYLHKFYREHATGKPNNDMPMTPKEKEISMMDDATYVSMEREYLKAFDIFSKESEKIWPCLQELIAQSKGDLEGQLHALLAMSVCKYEASEQRAQIFQDLDGLLQDAESANKVRMQALFDGLKGIALQHTIGDDARKVAKSVLGLIENKVSDGANLTFDQKLDLLWNTCALGLEEGNQLFKDLHGDIQMLNFERTHNDLTFEQSNKLRDYLLYITKVSPLKSEPWVQDVNDKLKMVMDSWKTHSLRYDETKANFDPFKKRVLIAVGKGLSMAGIDHQSTLEENLFNQGLIEKNMFGEQFPYEPDFIFGHNGDKILLNVIRAGETMRDVGLPDGAVCFRQRIMSALNGDRERIKSVTVPITSVVNYDIANLKLSLNEDYNLLDDIKRQVGDSSQSIDFSKLGRFGADVARDATVYTLSLKSGGDRQRMNSFIKQLYKVFQVKQQSERHYSNELELHSLNQLKVELMKLSLLHDNMPRHQSEYLKKLVPGGSNFNAMINEVRNSIKSKSESISSARTKHDEHLDTCWLGTRQEVELPQVPHFNLKKNIVPEMIDQRFMWFDDYFHYEDWKSKQQNVFDSFNLLVMPSSPDEFKFTHDRATNQRIVPQGIFPNPNEKRQLLQPTIYEAVGEDKRAKSLQVDEINAFQQNSMETMVRKEQARSASLEPLTENVSFMTNLQNLKQGLKQDYSDAEILNFMLTCCDFSDKLIEEHLASGKRQSDNQAAQNTKYLDRDPAMFREFMKDKALCSAKQADAYSDFFLKEAGKQERVHKAYNEATQQYQETIDNSKDPVVRERTTKLMKSLQDKIDDMLLENREENEDSIGLMNHFDTTIDINYNVNSLIKSQHVYDVDPDIESMDLSDEAFLNLQRRRAETKFIKSKIILKQHRGDALSAAEQKYLKQWVSEIENGRNVNLTNLRDTMLPRNHSSMTVGDGMSAEDLFAFNQVPNVELKRDKHAKFALNDVVLELSHFLDDDFVNRVEMQLVSERLRKQWDLPEGFQLMETRNKEIGLVFQELEEVAWRMAGCFNEDDMQTLKDMFSINRNKDYFDRQYYEQDMQSMSDFMNKVNPYDDRIKVMQEWLIRKEDEIKSRVNLPPKSFQKSDQEIFARIDRSQKKAREALVAKLLTHDVFGNDLPAETRTYQDLTTSDLNRISEALVARLGMFNGRYPAFMPHLVKAIMEHPNLSQSDHQLVKTYCQMFELDWRGDRDIKNKKEYLATNPVYINSRDRSNLEGYGQIGNFEVTAMLRQACQPFVEELAANLSTAANKK